MGVQKLTSIKTFKKVRFEIVTKDETFRSGPSSFQYESTDFLGYSMSKLHGPRTDWCHSMTYFHRHIFPFAAFSESPLSLESD